VGPWGVIAPVAKTTAVLDKGRTQTAQAVVMGWTVEKFSGSLGWHRGKHDLAEKIMHFLSEVGIE
jgi:hypothetical protein